MKDNMAKGATTTKKRKMIFIKHKTASTSSIYSTQVHHRPKKTKTMVNSHPCHWRPLEYY